MLLLAMTCLRAEGLDADVIRAVLRGDVHDALRMGLARLDRAGGAESASRTVLGQVLGQVLLAVGREGQAEELFQKQLRLYEALPRAQLRWMSSMDRGYLFLALNKPGRAAESFNVVADGGDEVPLPLRLEALAGLAMAVQGVGEQRRAARTLDHALSLAGQADPAWRRLLEAVGLELGVMQMLHNFDEPAADALRGAMDATLAQPLRAAAEAFAQMPLVSRRLGFLAALTDPALGTTRGAAPLFDALRWWREQRFDQVEELGRIEASLALLDHGNAQAATDILGALATEDGRQQHHRHSIELRYCVSKLHSMQGRHADALRCFRRHASQALSRLRSELQRVPYSRFLEQRERAEQADANLLSLPVRYRRAYQFMLDHLNEEALSIRRVAAHIDVTERALQKAFRTHLGLTPAEVIRQLRTACIRTEIQQVAGRESVLAVAKRWGMGNRSTLAHNYRQQFGETPTGTAASVDWGLAATNDEQAISARVA